MRRSYFCLAFLYATCCLLGVAKTFDDYLLPVIPGNVFGYLEWRHRLEFDVVIALLFFGTSMIWLCRGIWYRTCEKMKCDDPTKLS